MLINTFYSYLSFKKKNCMNKQKLAKYKIVVHICVRYHCNAVKKYLRE